MIPPSTRWFFYEKACLVFVSRIKVSITYAYDGNGNMVSDANKKITGIVYNHLNLPTGISINGSGGNGTISYIYDATGNKLEKKVTEGSTTTRTFYAGNYVYEKVNTNADVLKFFGHPEGYAEAEYSGSVWPGGDPFAEEMLSGFGYVYQYKDHLGNIRLSYSDTDNDGTISEAGIFNDGFESAGGWGSLSTGPIIYDAQFKHSGSYSGKIEKATVGEIVVHSDEWVAIGNPTATGYTYSGWVYSNGPSAEILLFMKTDAETGYFTHVDNVVTSATGQWVYLEKTFTVPSNIRTLNLRIDNNGGGTVWFDDVKIRKADSEILQENNYYPFGLEHKGYNNVVNGTHHPYDYQGKENQEELGLNWHNFGARNYDASLGRWMSPDPLSEEFPSWSPYNAMSDNPINFIDPNGMASMWIPKVNEDGSTSYIAEAGDSAKTLSSQYGISKDDAESITGTTGDTKITEGTEISGETVNYVTGSEVLKLDLNSKEGKSEQRRFDQFLFARDHSNSKGAYSFLSTDYFSKYGGVMEGNATINIDGKKVGLYYEIPMYRPATFDGSSTSTNLSNAPLFTKQTSGRTFPGNQENIYLPMYHPNTGNDSGQRFSIYTHTKTTNGIYKRLSKDFPQYNYIRIPKKTKN